MSVQSLPDHGPPAITLDPLAIHENLDNDPGEVDCRHPLAALVPLLVREAPTARRGAGGQPGDRGMCLDTCDAVISSGPTRP